MSLRPAEKPKVYDAQFNARLQRLERMVGQDSGGSSGDSLPAYDDDDIGKVLTVGSEYETTGEAIQMQSVTLVDSVGTLDAQKVDASKWTEGQLVSVVFNGTRYVLELSDIEGSISCGNEHFQLYYNSNTGVMTIEALDAESPVTVSAQYLTEHAHADWAEPSGGSLPPFTDSDVGKVLKIVKPVETVSVIPLQTVTTNAEGNAEISEVDFSRLTDGDTVILEFNDSSLNEIYHSTPIEGLYQGTTLLIDSTTLIGGPPNAEITIAAYAELPLQAAAKWANSTEVYIVRLINGVTDKTYSEIESALRSGRPCTLLYYVNGIITHTGIIFNAQYDPESEEPNKYSANYLVNTVVETMRCDSADSALYIM